MFWTRTSHSKVKKCVQNCGGKTTWKKKDDDVKVDIRATGCKDASCMK